MRRRVETVENAVVLLGMEQCGAVMTAVDHPQGAGDWSDDDGAFFGMSLKNVRAA